MLDGVMERVFRLTCDLACMWEENDLPAGTLVMEPRCVAREPDGEGEWVFLASVDDLLPVSAMILMPIRFRDGSMRDNSSVSPLLDSAMTISPFVTMPRSPCRASVGCRKKLGVPVEKFYVNVDRRGNCSSTSVLLALKDLFKTHMKP